MANSIRDRTGVCDQQRETKRHPIAVNTNPNIGKRALIVALKSAPGLTRPMARAVTCR